MRTSIFASAIGVSLCFFGHANASLGRQHGTAGMHGTTCGDPSTARELEPRPFVFPRDDGAHDDFAVESWRTFGRVRDMAGNSYDVAIVVERAWIGPCDDMRSSGRWKAKRIVFASYALLDERTGRRAQQTFVEREGSLGAYDGRARLNLSIAGLRLSETGDTQEIRRRFTLHLRGANDARLAVVESPERAITPLGRRGVSETGACASCEAYAYAYTRNAANGTLAIGGATYAVAGSMWLTHEFAHRELGAGDSGYDRFDLTFDDGNALDARFTHGAEHQSTAVSATRIDTHGIASSLDGNAASEANFPPSATWRSVPSNVVYPSAWLVNGLEIDPVVRDQEIYAAGRVPFYFGAIDATQQSGSGPNGHGFVELRNGA